MAQESCAIILPQFIAVCVIALRWVTFLLNLGMLGLCVLELFTLHATDGQTKATLIAPLFMGVEA